MTREENMMKAIELSNETMEELLKTGDWRLWRQDRNRGKLKESLCDACDEFAGWVTNEWVVRGDCADTQGLKFLGAWVYFYKNCKDWIQWENKKWDSEIGKYDYSPYSGERVKLLTTEEFNDVTNGKDLSDAIQRFTIHKQLEGETDGELTIERIEGLLEQLEHCKKRLKSQRKELIT